jgi:dephospho-CoA kinase
MKITQNQSLKLGVTGGIGSGKTTVCKVFTVLAFRYFQLIQRQRIQDRQGSADKNKFNCRKDLLLQESDRTEMAKLIFRRSISLAINS